MLYINIQSKRTLYHGIFHVLRKPLPSGFPSRMWTMLLEQALRMLPPGEWNNNHECRVIYTQSTFCVMRTHQKAQVQHQLFQHNSRITISSPDVLSPGTPGNYLPPSNTRTAAVAFAASAKYHSAFLGEKVEATAAVVHNHGVFPRTETERRNEQSRAVHAPYPPPPTRSTAQAACLPVPFRLFRLTARSV